MLIHFQKYQGTGNDFVMLDNLNGQYNDLTIAQIVQICDRRFGIGADGLIKINKHSSLDFEIDYYNSDGSKSFCGNGARCSVAFAKTLGIDVNNTRFSAIDGEHSAQMINETITLDMLSVNNVNQIDKSFELNTGSPHYIRFVENLENENIVSTGKEIRYSEPYFKEGINVNLVEGVNTNSIKIATYERGVEDETLSCGTGATACALIVGFSENRIGKNEIVVQVKGGNLKVDFDYLGNGSFTNIKLIGPAVFVFKGEINV
jgi:diaminopimelate epimerase